MTDRSPASGGGFSAYRITLTAMLAGLALIFSYIEAILPFQPGIPGVKLGLANLVVLSLVSFLVMYLCFRSGLFSVIGVSLAGGVAHNFGQLAVAAFIVSTARIFLYFPVLLFSGMAAGIVVGIGAYILIGRIPDQIFRR